MDGACFAAGTPLLTPDGSRPIEQFRPGDWVLSCPEDDPEAVPVPRLVEAVFANYTPLLDLHVGGRTIRTTAEHPFWVRGRGWTDAQQLVAGDHLRGHDGRWVAVEAVAGSQEAAPVYNLRIAEDHTYFVGEPTWGFSVWAHNNNQLCAFGNTQGPRPPRPGKDIDVDPSGMVHPTEPPTGASMFGDPNQAPLSGHYHTIPADTPPPPGTGIKYDGIDVGGTEPPTHATFYPTESMPFTEYVEKFLNLGWSYGGKK